MPDEPLAPLSAGELDAISVSLNRNELALLYRMVDDRIIQAEKDGIGPDDSSSVFRTNLRQKLLDAMMEDQQAHANEEALANLEQRTLAWLIDRALADLEPHQWEHYPHIWSAINALQEARDRFDLGAVKPKHSIEDIRAILNAPL